MQLFLSVTAAQTQEASRYTRALAHRSYRIGPESTLLRQSMLLQTRGGLLSVSSQESPRVEDPEALCAAVLRECSRRGYSGAVLDFQVPIRSDLERFAGQLSRTLSANRRALYVPESYAPAAPGAIVLISTALSRLNVFLDTEMEQVLCFDSPIDAEMFASQKCAIFLIVPEEDTTKHFMASLTIQNLARELFSVADENDGKLKNRVVFFCDELGTMPPFDILPLFSAGRSRRLTLVPIIQSIAQLEKNYGREGAEIIQDNVQDTIFGGFAPSSQTAEVLSKALGNRTVMSGSISRGKGETSQSLQMIERPLMTPDELKSIPKGHFIVMKTGTHPMQTRLRLFLEWGITFGQPYQVPQRAARKVYYAGKEELTSAIYRAFPARTGMVDYYTPKKEEPAP